MLQDPRSEALIDNFAGQWLFLRNVPGTDPRQASSRTSTTTCAQAFRRETELFFETIVREDRSAIDLLTRRLHVPQRAARIITAFAPCTGRSSGATWPAGRHPPGSSARGAS